MHACISKSACTNTNYLIQAQTYTQPKTARIQTHIHESIFRMHIDACINTCIHPHARVHACTTHRKQQEFQLMCLESRQRTIAYIPHGSVHDLYPGAPFANVKTRSSPSSADKGEIGDLVLASRKSGASLHFGECDPFDICTRGLFVTAYLQQGSPHNRRLCFSVQNWPGMYQYACNEHRSPAFLHR
jgi:hypothetical protein